MVAASSIEICVNHACSDGRVLNWASTGVRIGVEGSEEAGRDMRGRSKVDCSHGWCSLRSAE
jgi:hypothetical protein